MSKDKFTIEVCVPDVIIPDRNKEKSGIACKEVFYSNWHQCSYCHGNGYFWSEDCHGESYKKECPVCKGSGKLNAVITIEWSANKII